MSNWFQDARLGMFIHWGHVSQRGSELSWPLVGGLNPALPKSQSIGVQEYHASAKTFDPVLYDPREWARLAAAAGMRYAVLTTKHHDGFAMFHTRETDYSIEHSPYGKDIVREYADAFRAAGLRVGFYFSLIDWHHPDYPNFVEADKPYRFGQWRRSAPEAWERFVRSMFAQIRELLINYGKIDLLWFDGGWERRPEEWHSAELEKMIRSLQPEILINDRLSGAGDFDTPEQALPAEAPGRAWETCLTINDSWGYNPTDRNLKSARTIVQILCEAAGKGGNLLLNVSPMGSGKLPAEHVERLEALARWTHRNGRAIFESRPGLKPWQFYGPSTRAGDTIYLFLLMRPYDTVSVRGVQVKRVRSVRALSTGEELTRSHRIAASDAIFNRDPLGELIISVPERAIDEFATVIAVEFEPVSAQAASAG